MNKNFTRIATSLAVAFICFLPFQLSAKDHVIERGETIESIAKAYGLKPSDIIEANPTVKDMFFIGMVITIPEKSSEIEEESVTEEVESPGQEDVVTPYVPESPEQRVEGTSQNQDSKVSNIFATKYNYNAETESGSLPRAFGFADLMWRVNLSGSGGSFGDRSAYGLQIGGYFKTYQRLYLGFEALFTMNFGLSDYKFYAPELYLGPAFALNEKGNLFVSVPLGCAFNLVDKYNEDGAKDGTKLNVPFIVRPTLHYTTGKVNLNLGFPLCFEHEFQFIVQVGIGLVL